MIAISNYIDGIKAFTIIDWVFIGVILVVIFYSVEPKIRKFEKFKTKLKGIEIKNANIKLELKNIIRVVQTQLIFTQLFAVLMFIGVFNIFIAINSLGTIAWLILLLSYLVVYKIYENKFLKVLETYIENLTFIGKDEDLDKFYLHIINLTKWGRFGKFASEKDLLNLREFFSKLFTTATTNYFNTRVHSDQEVMNELAHKCIVLVVELQNKLNLLALSDIKFGYDEHKKLLEHKDTIDTLYMKALSPLDVTYRDIQEVYEALSTMNENLSIENEEVLYQKMSLEFSKKDS